MEPVLRWIFLVSFLDLFAVSLLIPLMSAHLKALGASHFVMGCMTSVYALFQLISGPIVGSWSDRVGRQRIFVTCLLVISCCYILSGTFKSLILLMLIRAVAGTFKHSQVLVRTMISDKVPEERQAVVFGHLKAVASVSFTVGPAIGGNLAEFENGFKYVCYFAGALFILSSAIVYFFLGDNEKPDKDVDLTSKTREKEETGGSIMDAIRDLAKVDWPIYGNIFALKFLLDFSAGAFHNNYSVKLTEKFDITPKTAGYTISFQSFVATLSGLCIDIINRRFYSDDVDYRKRNLHSYALMTIAYLGIAATNRLETFMLWSVLLKSVHMFFRMISTEMIIRMCPFNQRGSLMGSANSISSVARLITPLLAGYIEDAWGSNSGNVLAASTAAIGIIVAARIPQRHSKTN